MVTSDNLEKKLIGIDGRDYGAYQSLKGTYTYSDFSLEIIQIPKDPFAPPHTGIYRLQIEQGWSGILNHPLTSKTVELSLRDFLARRFSQACDELSSGRRGTGNSGLITINQPKQCVLERSCVLVTQTAIEVRFFIGLPAKGRKINSSLATRMLLDELPMIVEKAFAMENIDQALLNRHIETVIDAQFLRSKLSSLGLAAFIAEGAILPRESGDSDRPMPQTDVIPFAPPPELIQEIDLPHAGKIRGMGIPKGVTLIVGGGYHGKSTVLEAIEAGIYPHVPDDGREYCVSDPDTVKIQASSGRSIVKTNISPFIRNLPFQKDTTAFSTENASGSTSQAANIMEAIEIGAKVILMDEDTCATNFMIRDVKMQALVEKEDEPITAFIDKVRQLYTENGISTILVLGGAGDYFEVADHVIQMKQYRPIEVTARAKHIVASHPAKRVAEDATYPISCPPRRVVKESVSPVNRYGKRSVYAKEKQRFVFGQNEVELLDVAHIVELSQTKTIAMAMEYVTRYMDGQRTIFDIVTRIIDDIEKNGLDIISQKISGEFAQIRAFEIAFALNRLRSLRVTN